MVDTLGDAVAREVERVRVLHGVAGGRRHRYGRGSGQLPAARPDADVVEVERDVPVATDDPDHGRSQLPVDLDAEGVIGLQDPGLLSGRKVLGHVAHGQSGYRAGENPGADVVSGRLEVAGEHGSCLLWMG